MTEAYLQDVWNSKRFHSPSLELVDGTPITIIDTGVHNLNRSGPDFEMGRIRIDNITLVGPIEIHINASDWMLHKHQADRSYDNVILHVVHNFDREIIQNGRVIPTVELNTVIHQVSMTEKLGDKHRFLCREELLSIDPIYLESMKSKAVMEKLQAKSNTLNELTNQDPCEVFYYLLLGAFGMNINKPAFEELALDATYRSIEPLKSTQRLNLLLAKSGLMNEDYARRKGYVWNKKGTRPANFPWKRLEVFSTLLATFPLTKFANGDMGKHLFKEVTRELEDAHCNLSQAFQNHLLINAIVPFYFWKSQKSSSTGDTERVVDELSRITPEKNRIIKWWEKIGVIAKDAYDSQALIALHRYYCCRKKCLSCEVGRKLLNRL